MTKTDWSLIKTWVNAKIAYDLANEELDPKGCTYGRKAERIAVEEAESAIEASIIGQYL